MRIKWILADKENKNLIYIEYKSMYKGYGKSKSKNNHKKIKLKTKKI